MQQRYVFTLLAFLGNMSNMLGRDSLRIVVLAIKAEYDSCQSESSNCGPVVWDDGTVAQVLGSFNYGMVVSMLLGGPLADMVGGKYLLLTSTMVSSMCTLLLPVLAGVSLPAIVFSQVVYGLSGGVVVSSLASMIVRWEPPTERGRLSTMIYSGSPMSAIFTALLTGLLIQHTHWSSVFYILGSLPLLWILPWLLLVTDSPLDSSTISPSELNLLTTNQSPQSRPHIRDIPLLSIITSAPVWACILANIGVAWVCAHTSLLLPQYFAGYLGLDLQDTGLISSLPYLGCFLTGLVASLLYTQLTTTWKLPASTARKICNSLCLWGYASLCLPLPFLPRNPLLATILSTSSYSLTGFNLVASFSNPQDICPHYVATVMSMLNLASYLVYCLVPHTLTLASVVLPPDMVWPGLFLLVSCVAIFTNLIYIILATADVQSWDSLERKGSVLDCVEERKDREGLLEKTENTLGVVNSQTIHVAS